MSVWSKIKKPLIFILLAAVAIGYYIYLTHRDVGNDEKLVEATEVSRLANRDLSLNYPATARAVIIFYSDIIKAYYKENFTDEELLKLANNARGLFDEELLKFNDEESYIIRLKDEIENYKTAGKFISDYKIEDGYNIEYFKFQEEDYARIDAKYYVREGNNLVYVYEEYTMKKDSDGKWKILFWESSDASKMEG